MEEARRLQAQGYPGGCIITDTQTAGRGRGQGRQWLADPGSSLLCTIWLPASEYGAAPPSLVAGAALLQALRQTFNDANFNSRPPAGDSSIANDPALCIKWPNDVLSGQSKLAGILCEATADYIYTGIGLNMTQSSFSGNYRRPPVSLQQVFAIVPSREQLLMAICRSLYNFCREGHSWHDFVNQYLAWRNLDVIFEPGTGNRPPVRGILHGIATDGQLLIKVGSEIASFNSGELSKAPVV